MSGASRIYLVEGEKSADLIRKLGLVATTTAHGAQAPGKSDYSPLTGKEIIAIPDRDEPGESYVAQVAALVAKLDPRPTFKIVRLPVTGEGDDIELWLSDVVPKEWTPDERRVELERLTVA